MKRRITSDRRRSWRGGFYTVEAAIFLPLVILAVISIGYFIKIDAAWENAMHGAVDESSLAASRAFEGSPSRIEKRIAADNPQLEYVHVGRFLRGYSDGVSENLTSYVMNAGMNMKLPLGFSRDSDFTAGVKYRRFIGKRTFGSGMGSEGLETDFPQDPVWIFPLSGIRYHEKNCTYVRASVSGRILSPSLKRKYAPCGLCNSGDMSAGELVFCFRGKDTAYHRGSCPSINRHTVVIDRSEAIEKGYTPCSKCM